VARSWRSSTGCRGGFEAIDACGLPASLVHGDFHPGNVRGERGRLVLLDWGDSGIGHPLLDQPAFLTRIDGASVEPVRGAWHAAWSAARPGADPARAAHLLAPVAAARQAVIYQRFLDEIEPSERPYHAADVPDWLGRTAELLHSSGSSPKPA
jgi:aminoglycoside phosphotransferase (APT) family kinase protein